MAANGKSLYGLDDFRPVKRDEFKRNLEAIASDMGDLVQAINRQAVTLDCICKKVGITAADIEAHIQEMAKPAPVQ